MEVEFSISRAISDGNHPLRKWDGEELEQIAPDLLRRDELSRIAFEYFDDKYCGEEWLDQMTSFDTLKDERGDYFCFAANDRGVAYYEQIDKLRIIYNDYDVRFFGRRRRVQQGRPYACGSYRGCCGGILT